MPLGIFLLVFILFKLNYSESSEPIKSDGIGYYDYLPAFFIHHDLNRKDQNVLEDSESYQRLSKYGVYVEYQDHLINKYAVGTAVLQMPFFLVAKAISPETDDGYGPYFQEAVRAASYFYLGLGLILLFQLFKLYGINSWIIILCFLLIVFSTPAYRYLDREASFSHIYSFFALNLFAYWAKKFFVEKEGRFIVYAGLSIGLVLLIRNVDALIILIVPFLAGSWSEFKKGFNALLKHWPFLLLGILAALVVFGIQMWVWNIQSDHWLIYSYQGEGFKYWSEPKLMSLWFSYRKGLFLYTPVLFIAFLSSVHWLFQKKYFLFFTWFSFFMIISYVMASWWSWWYGASYGQRPFINYYLLFFLPFALFLKSLKWQWALPVVLISLLSIPHNMIQLHQYQSRILQWNYMNKERYWQVFLKTEPQYQDLFWKEQYNFRWMQLEKEIELGDFEVEPHEMKRILRLSSKEIPNFDILRAFRIELDDQFEESDQSQVEIKIKYKGERVFWRINHTLMYQEKGFDKWQRGYVNYKVMPHTMDSEAFVEILLFGGEKAKTFHNMKLKIYSQELPN